MKLTAKYNLKKGIVMGLLAALPMFNACEKPDPAPEPTPVTPTPVTPTTQKHNVELVYGVLSSTDWENISLDTIRKYNADPTVDTIFMVPEEYNQFSTVSTSGLQGRVAKLRERHNVNPNKIFGKGELQLRRDAVENNPEIVRFFADTLKYNVTYHDVVKSR